MIDQKEMMELMFRVMCPAGSGFPGANLSNAEEIVLGLCVFIYLKDDPEDSITLGALHDILMGKWAGTGDMKLGQGFGAALQVNQGNKYALNVIASTLQGYNGKEVPGNVAALLNVLEGYVKLPE